MRQLRHVVACLPKLVRRGWPALVAACAPLLFFLYVHLQLIVEHEPTPLPRYTNVLTFSNWENLTQRNGPMLRTLSLRSTKVDEHSGDRFVLGINYWEQMNMATLNFFKLSCLASKWNARTVKPFTYNSRLYGLKNFKADDNINNTKPMKELDLLYSIDSLNQLLRQRGIPELVNFEDFLLRSVRNLTVLHFIPEKEVREIPVMRGKIRRDISHHFKVDNIIDCSKILVGYANQLLNALTAETDRIGVRPFHIAKYFCINMSHVTSSMEIMRRVGMNHHGNLSIIIVNWRGMTNQTMVASAKGLHTNNRILMPDNCHNELQTGNIMVAHSNAVMEAVQQHLRHLSLDSFVAIHFRTEKMGTRSPRFPGSFEQCFLKVLQIKDEILKSGTSMTVVYLVDYGPYSSDTCRKCRGSAEMKRMLRKWQIKTLPHFDPVLAGSSDDSGFAAAVEMELLAHGEYLVLCGGGAFQGQAALRFLKRNPKDGRQRLFRVCVDDKSVQGVMNTSD